MKGFVTTAPLTIRTNAGVALTGVPGGASARQHCSRCWHPRLVEGSPRMSEGSPHTCWNWVAHSHACTPHTSATQAWEPVAPSSQGPDARGLMLCSSCPEILNYFSGNVSFERQVGPAEHLPGPWSLGSGVSYFSHFWSPWERSLAAWSWPPGSLDPARLPHSLSPDLTAPGAQAGSPLGTVPPGGCPAHCFWRQLASHAPWPSTEGGGQVQSLEGHRAWDHTARGWRWWETACCLWTPGGRVEVSGTPRVCPHPTKCPLLKEEQH